MPGSPLYKFKYTFYNIPKGQNNNQSLIQVELSKDEITKRRAQQTELILKLNDAKFCVNKDIELLRNKKEATKNRLKNLIAKYRRISKQYMANTTLLPAQIEKEVVGIKREKFYLIRNGESFDFTVLEEMKEKLEKFLKKINEDIRNIDSKVIYNN
ncbi:hypothetical protein NUSPORA_02785 [Nucleospora cyclopteri]